MTVLKEGNKNKRTRPNRKVIIYSFLILSNKKCYLPDKTTSFSQSTGREFIHTLLVNYLGQIPYADSINLRAK